MHHYNSLEIQKAKYVIPQNQCAKYKEKFKKAKKQSKELPRIFKVTKVTNTDDQIVEEEIGKPGDDCSQEFTQNLKS